jgi:acetyltransferase-like isoleucine patch superfamily enzyme
MINPLPRIDGKIDAPHIEIGLGAVVESTAHISADRVILGEHCYIGHGVRIITPEFRLGDYSKLHAGSFGHGEQPLRIGRNCWIGGNVILDTLGGLDIDDNVGIGASSQIWTHIQFGDIVEGCRFHSRQYMHIGRDAWFVGHCIVSPVQVEPRSMALVGSVITKDMQANHIYAGVPAKDVTDKMGTQFAPRTPAEKAAHLCQIIADFDPDAPHWLQVVTAPPDDPRPDVTYFNVCDRTYTRTRSALEIAFLKKHTPLIKFTPYGAKSFIE